MFLQVVRSGGAPPMSLGPQSQQEPGAPGDDDHKKPQNDQPEDFEDAAQVGHSLASMLDMFTRKRTEGASRQPRLDRDSATFVPVHQLSERSPLLHWRS